MFDINKIYKMPLIHKIYQLCYMIIKFTIQSNSPNELYASQWINMIMKHTLLTNKYNDFYAESTLIELLDDNTELLESRITKETICLFVNMLTVQERDSKYVNILRALVNSNGKAVLSNQTIVSMLVLDDVKTKNTLIFNLKHTKDGIIYKSKDTNRWKLLQTFKDEYNPSYVDYFASIILLLADLCLDRNKIAQQSLQKIYSFELCYKIISHEVKEAKDDYGLEIRRAFVKLMITLWIDCTGNSKLLLPNYMR